MVFEDVSKNQNRPHGQKYTKAPLELNDLFSRVVPDKESIPAPQDILAKYGYSKANSATQLAHKLSAIVQNVGEPALKDIALIHPDKELILHLCSTIQEPITVIKEIIKEVPAKADMHDCGCSGKHHSAEGGYPRNHYGYSEGEAFSNPDDKKYLKPVLLLSFSLLAIAVILKW